MDATCLTVGGFCQPSVARTLIEQSGSAEIGISQRFLWLIPQPAYSRSHTLESVDEEFIASLGKVYTVVHLLWQLFLVIIFMPVIVLCLAYVTIWLGVLFMVKYQ